MQQTLFYIPDWLFFFAEWFRLNKVGVGWILTFWVGFCLVLMTWLVRRQGWNDDTKSYLPILALVAAGIVFLAPRLIEPGLGLPIRGYGVMVTLGVVLGVGLSAWQARRMGLDPEVIFSLAFWMFAAGIGGARVAYVVQYWNQFYHKDDLWLTLASIVNITKGGLVVYGSVIGGLAAWYIFCRLRKLPLLAIGDLIAPGMLVGLALGRIGCLCNGCCYGGVCEGHGLPAISFPHFADARAQKPSDPYVHQQTLGLLHGFRLGPDKQGNIVVTDVRPDSAADKAGLEVGATIKRIDLDPSDAMLAALTVPELAGHELEIETTDGRNVVIPIGSSSPTDGDGRSYNALGFTIEGHGAGGIFVESLEAGGRAQQAGLKTADKIKSIHLPTISSYAAARGILQNASLTLLLETEGGKTFDVSLTELPPRSRPVHPSQIYSTIKASLLAFFLWSYYPFRRRDGEVFALMLTIYPLFRTLLEIIRDDVDGLWGTPVTFSQAVSGVILVIAAALWIYLLRQPKGSVLPPVEPVAA